MKKKNINFILYLIIFLFAGIIVFAACKQTNQPFLAMSLQLKFVGEYSQDDFARAIARGVTDYEQSL